MDDIEFLERIVRNRKAAVIGALDGGRAPYPVVRVGNDPEDSSPIITVSVSADGEDSTPYEIIKKVRGLLRGVFLDDEDYIVLVHARRELEDKAVKLGNRDELVLRWFEAVADQAVTVESACV